MKEHKMELTVVKKIGEIIVRGTDSGAIQIKQSLGGEDDIAFNLTHEEARFVADSILSVLAEAMDTI